MSDLPLVSCLLATYNFDRYLPRAIESVLNQDYPNLQLVVVDDGSTDSTPEVVKPYLSEISYIRKANGGLRSTVNRLLAEAEGEFIGLHSGDDIWLPGRIKTQVDQLMANERLGLVYGDCEIIDEHDNMIAPSLWEKHGTVPLRGKPVFELMLGNRVSGGTLMMRSSLLPLIAPMPDYAPWEDWWMALQAARYAEIDYAAEPIYGYRQHGKNMNLGVDTAGQLRLGEAELPFRRWMLTGLESDLLDTSQWLAVHQSFAQALMWVARGTGREPHELIDISDADNQAATAALKAARELASSGRVPGAVREYVRALGHNPFWQPLLEEVRKLISAEARSEPGPPELQARGFRVLCRASELCADPRLLESYADVFGGDDDVSLVVLLAESQVESLEALLRRSGLDGEDGPDMVGVTGKDSLDVSESFAGQVHAVLSASSPGGALSKVPHFDRSNLTALARLYQLSLKS